MKRGFIRLIFLWAAFSLPALAQGMQTEQSVRAAMVFNFLKFTELPSNGAAGVEQLRLCVDVEDPMQAEALFMLSGHRVWGRELLVVRFSGRDDGCQVFYVDSRQRWNAVEEQGVFRRALTISAYPGFVHDGGMIEMVLREEGTRFDINLASSRRAGIRFLPQLLRLARHVHE